MVKDYKDSILKMGPKGRKIVEKLPGLLGGLEELSEEISPIDELWFDFKNN